jgi:hypothetical protein
MTVLANNGHGAKNGLKEISCNEYDHGHFPTRATTALKSGTENQASKPVTEA